MHRWDVEKDVGLIDLITMRESGLLTTNLFLSSGKNLSHLFLFIFLQNKLVEEMLKMKTE